MNISVLDTTPRRIAWRKAFPKPEELSLLAEVDLREEFQTTSIICIHVTDFACDTPDEHIKNARKIEIARNYGGDSDFAEEVCSRIVSLRQKLRSTPIEARPILLLYSGASPSDFAAQKPVESILNVVLPDYSREKIVMLPKQLNQIHSHTDLRRTIHTSVYSLANCRRLPDDLQTVANCVATLEALKVFNNDTEGLLAQFDVAGQRDALARYLQQGVEPDPGMLLEFCCLVEQAARNVSLRV